MQELYRATDFNRKKAEIKAVISCNIHNTDQLEADR